MSIGLTSREKNLVGSATVLGLFFIVLTVLLRSCVFPSPEEERLTRIQKTIDQQFMPYAAAIEAVALQHPDLSVEIDKAEDCAHDYLKSLLSPAHPAITAWEAAEATRACMLERVRQDMKSGRDADNKEGEQLARVTGPMVAAVAASRHQ